MKTALAAVAVLLALSVCARAQQDFFGMTPEDAQAMMGKAMADQARHEAELAQQRAKKAQGPGYVDLALGTYATLTNPQECILRAVGRHLGQPARSLEGAPKVYLESRTILEDFQVYVHNERDSWPNAFSTIYLRQANIIFLDDHSSLYSPKRTLDDALAGQYAAALSVGRVAEPVDVAESWFHETYTKPGLSACDAN